MVFGVVFTSSFSLSENVSTSFCCSWLPAPAAIAFLEQLLCRHLPNHQACVNTLGLGGEQHGWQKISGLGKGQENLFPYLFVVLVKGLLAGFVPDAGRCCSMSWLADRPVLGDALCHLHLGLCLLEDWAGFCPSTVGVWPSPSKPQHDMESAAGLADKQLLLPLPWLCDTTIFLSLHVEGGVWVCVCMSVPALPPPPDTPQPFSIQVCIKEWRWTPKDAALSPHSGEPYMELSASSRGMTRGSNIENI